MRAKRVFTLLLLLTLISCNNVSTTREPEKQDLFNTSNGDGVIPPHRIPGIAKTKNGRLIAVAARLVCGTDPGYGKVDAVCRISDDNGKSWSEIRDIALGTGRTSATENFFDTAFGDPAIVANRTSDEVAVIVVTGCTVYAHHNTTRKNPNMIGIVYSNDNGESWGEPIDITEQIYSLFDEGNPVESCFVAGGKVFQSRIVKRGEYYRLYAALCARPNGNRVLYSDDFGRTWSALGGASALPAPTGDEPKCEETPDGRVILSSRVGGGRIFNMFTYSNTMEGTGSWSSDVWGRFEGSGKKMGMNATNGEILIVPVKRNSDNSNMYLALQSVPTGDARIDVGIFYKELASYSDYNSVEAFAADWDGFFAVSDTTSAYSSMDLQADNRIGLIYEETHTSFGKRKNVVSTTFPNGEGEHNFDGYNNVYVNYALEDITNGAYSIELNVVRGDIVKQYFTDVVNRGDFSDEVKNDIIDAINGLSNEPSPAELDNIHNMLRQ